MGSTGKVLVVVGAVVVATGLLLMLASALGLGRLPGDFEFRWGRGRIFVPLATCLVLSIVLSLVLSLISRRRG